MENQTIGIKLADGSFYPILAEGQAASMILELTTVRDDQQTVQLDLYRSPDATMNNAEYVDTLLIENLIPRPSEQPSISLKIDLDEDNTLSASIEDEESGESSSLTVSLLNLDATRLSSTPDFVLSDENNSKFEFADPSDIQDITSQETVFDDFDAFTDVPIEDEAANEEIPLNTEPSEFSSEAAYEESFVDDEQEDALAEQEDALGASVNSEISEDTLPLPPDTDIDYHFSDISVMEDVPRQNSSKTDEFSIDEETVMDEASIEEDSFMDSDSQSNSLDNDEIAHSDVAEEEFPDFQDISLSETKNEEIQINEEDDSSLFDFGEEFKDESFDDSIPAPSFSFSDLYEEEHMEKEEKTSNKTFIPVIICIICAVISVAALALILFFGPLRSKDSAQQLSQTDSAYIEPPASEPVYSEPPAAEPVIIEPLSVEPVIEPEEIFAQSTVEEPAKENEVVKIETEVVVPEVPAAPKTEEKGVSYKIKWGDTLWDIADAYYKNPWLYPKIAKFNGIKNPDVIISGTWITIPPR
jgi:LysM repeat protein